MQRRLRRPVAGLLLLCAGACGSNDSTAPPKRNDGPLAWLVIESSGAKPLEVKGPRPGELPPDRRDARGELWRIPTLYGQRGDVPGAILEAVVEGGARLAFPDPAPRTGAGPGAREVVVLRDPNGRWHVVRDPAATPPEEEAHDVTSLRLRVSATAKPAPHGTGGGRGAGTGSGGGAMDGSGGMRGVR